MNADQELELISAAIDGEIDGRERAEVDRLLRHSTEARRFRAILERMGGMLSDVPAAEPPDTLRRRLMADLPDTAPVPGFRDRSLRWPTGAILKYAAAAAAVVLLVLPFTILRGVDGDATRFAGTMAPAGPILDSDSFVDGRSRSLVRIRRSGGLLLLDVAVESSEPLDISIDLGGTGLSLGGVSQVEGSIEYLQFADRVLKVRAVGKREMTAVLRRSDDAAESEKAVIPLEISSRGRSLKQGVLEPAL